MTNETTINVPRELLENIVLCYNEGEFELGTLAAECHALLSAPSPANHIEDVRAMVKAQGVVMPTVDQAMRGVLREMGSSKHIRGTSNWCADVGRAVLEEVARLNAAPVHQVSVPAWMASSRAFADRLYMAGWRDHADAQHSGVAGMYDELLSSAPAAPAADAWISVSERLPNIAQEVIAHSEFDGVCAGVLDSYGEWFAPCSEYKLVRVTSWMPMPTKIEANRHD